MALTRLTDVIVPEIFAGYMAKDTVEKSAIFQSGVIKADSELGSNLAGGGTTFNAPFWNDLDNTEGGIASDDPAVIATPGKIGALKSIVRRQVRTRSWSTADLSGVLAGSDPMQRIRERVNAYWTRQFQRSMVQTLAGVFADNIANDSSDMVKVIGNDSASAVTDAELVSAESILDTKQLMGDAADDLKVIIMHSVVYTRLQKLNLIDFVPDSEGHIKFAYYLGYLVIVDDGVQTVTGTNRVTYTTYLLGQGALGWAETSNNFMPVEVRREPGQGNGMGVEILYTRRAYCLHPYGFAWKEAAVAGNFPTNAELATATNWDRVYPERKQVPITALRTNG
jgi:hypothetical protein